MPESYEEIMKDVDSYNETVWSILALMQHLNYQYKFDSFLGKRLTTSPSNSVQPNTCITPDVVSNADRLGIVTEVKLRLTPDENDYEEAITQAKKYDDHLSGWPTGDKKVDKHDVILLTHQARSTKLKNTAQRLIDKELVKLDRNLAILEYNRNSEHETFFWLRAMWGRLSNTLMQARLEEGVQVNSKYLAKMWAKTRFYDGVPPVVLTMSLLWDHHISKKPTDDERRGAAVHSKVIIVTVNVDEAREDLMAQFGCEQKMDGQCEIPKREWIVISLETFEQLKHAKKVGSDTYEVKYRHYPGMSNTIEFFAKELADDSQQIRLNQFP